MLRIYSPAGIINLTDLASEDAATRVANTIQGPVRQSLQPTHFIHISSPSSETPLQIHQENVTAWTIPGL
jgi:hypothetical protein